MVLLIVRTTRLDSKDEKNISEVLRYSHSIPSKPIPTFPCPVVVLLQLGMFPAGRKSPAGPGTDMQE